MMYENLQLIKNQDEKSYKLRKKGTEQWDCCTSDNLLKDRWLGIEGSKVEVMLLVNSP